MEKNGNKSYILAMIIGVLCLIVIIATATYAYFTSDITGNGGSVSVTTANSSLTITESKINVSNAAPILEATKDTKALSNTFTIGLGKETPNACYTLSLEIDNIGENLKNEWFKYELVKDNSVLKSGDFSGLTYDANGKSSIQFVQNQELSSSNKSNTYTLRLWLEHSENDDQSYILKGDEQTRTFNGHIYASGNASKCN